MASQQAKNYFSTFSSGDQENILKSWGNRDAMDEWYSNAQKSGATGGGGGGASGGGAPSGYDSPDQLSAFQNWYKQQQGGRRPEDMDRFLQGDTLKRWDPYLQREGQYAGKYKSSRGAEGYYDKPTECPPGMVPSGPDETDPCIPGGGAGGGGGGGGAGGSGGAGGGGGYGGGGVSGGGWNNPVYKYLAGSSMEAAADPEVALKNYMGYGGSQAFSDDMDKTRAQIQLMPPGPARDAALAGLEERKLTSLGTMKQQASAAARGELTGLVAPEQGYAGMDLSKYQGDQQNELGWAQNATNRYGIDSSTGLGYAGLAQDSSQFGQNMDYQRWAQGGNWNQNDLDRASQERLAGNQIQAGKKGILDKVLGGAGAAAGLAKMYLDYKKGRSSSTPAASASSGWGYGNGGPASA